jgi:hypothetical protein
MSSREYEYFVRHLVNPAKEVHQEEPPLQHSVGWWVLAAGPLASTILICMPFIHLH